MTLDAEHLRRLMRAWTSGVTIVSAAHGADRHGMTVSSFTSVSLEPPLVVISLHSEGRTHQLVQASGAFAVTILSAEQQHISELFAGRTEEVPDRFAGLEVETLLTGSPALKAGLARLDCRVVQSFPVGMNTLYLAEVVAIAGDEDGLPLVYHNRGYWKLTK
ncbi:MAG TPA: flavin reductase family protein [Anaerolineales bacterium]